MEIISEKLTRAIEYLLPKVKERMDYCTIPWVSGADSLDLETTFGVSPHAAGKVYAAIKERLGRPVEMFRGHTVELAELIRLLSITGGELTDAIRLQFKAKFPEVPISGPLVKAARSKLGIDKPTELPIPMVQSGLLAKANRCVIEYQRLVDQEAELEEQLAAIRAKKTKYAQISRKFEEMGAALRSLEDEERQTIL